MEKTALNVIPSLSYKENGASRNAMTDIKMIKENALNALTSLKLKDVLIHPNQLSADPDTSYQEEIASIAAPREQLLTPIESASHAEPLVFNALKRTSAKDAYQLMFFTMEPAYPNVLPDSSMSLEFANLAHKTLVTYADLKTEDSVPTVLNPSFLHTEFAFLPALLEDGETETDAENAILRALLVSRKALALLASLNSPSTRELAFLNVHLEKSLFSETVFLVKTLTA
jgi:hypothetical protein